MSKGHAQRPGRARGWPSVAPMYDPSAGVLHGQAGRRPRRPWTPSTSPLRSARNIRRVAQGRSPPTSSDVTVCILDRPPAREPGHRGPARPGARIHFISDGRCGPAAIAVRPGRTTGVDLLMGIGGTPGGHHRGRPRLKCVGGAIQAKLWPKDAAERQKALDAGPGPRRGWLTTDHLVKGRQHLSSAPPA